MRASFDEVNQLSAAENDIDDADIDDYVDAVLALYDAGNDAKKLELS